MIYTKVEKGEIYWCEKAASGNNADTKKRPVIVVSGGAAEQSALEPVHGGILNHSTEKRENKPCLIDKHRSGKVQRKYSHLRTNIYD